MAMLFLNGYIILLLCMFFPRDVIYVHSIQRTFLICTIYIIVFPKLPILNVGVSVPSIIVHIAMKT